MRRLAHAVITRSPGFVREPTRQRHLLLQLTRRDVEVRYRGSRLGLLWSIINPLLLLAVYTFVFGTIFKGRWEGQDDTGVLYYALIIFAGLIVMTLFTETVVRCATSITGVPNYVKRVVFPLDLIPLSILGGSLFHFVTSFGVLLVLTFAISGPPSLTIFALPLVILPVLLMAAGVGWFLASLGVFLRDLTYIVQIVTQVILFLTPVFYPDELIPNGMRPFVLSANPLAHTVHDMREMLLFGGPINWAAIAVFTLIGAVIAMLGHMFFERTRPVFADVI